MQRSITRSETIPPTIADGGAMVPHNARRANHASETARSRSHQVTRYPSVTSACRHDAFIISATA